MNWYHGPKSWSELERVLSGRPNPRGPENPHPGDGSDAPAWSRARGEYTPPQRTRAEPWRSRVPYAELHAHSAFSFLDGASSPEVMAETAAELGLTALAITDHDGLYGVVRFAEAAEPLRALVDAGVRELLVISQDTSAYGADLKYAPFDWRVTLRLPGTPEMLAARIPTWCGIVEAEDEHNCLLRIGAESPEALLAQMLMVGAEAECVEGRELLPHLREVLDRAAATLA